ncbi:MAG: phytanoyl-CoA dioxygenase family protein [Planctomycetes bacterium]|nr:phytanoyl-CoA dioxygenase family protein [Planctomycetota bacterium]
MTATPSASPAASLLNSSSSESAPAAFFREHGYWIARGLVDPQAITDLTRDFDRTVSQMEASSEHINARWRYDTTTAVDGDPQACVIHTHQIQKYSAAWMRWLLDERWLDACELLLGPDIVLHHTKLFLKPAGRGAAFPPHQDWSYFPTAAHQMIAATVALTSADDANGCLRLWPGSHKLGPLPASNGADGAFAARFPFADSIVAEVQPGDVVFFSYLTVHGSLPNTSPRPRKSVLVQLHSGGDLLETGGHPASEIVLRGWNHRMTRERADAS